MSVTQGCINGTCDWACFQVDSLKHQKSHVAKLLFQSLFFSKDTLLYTCFMIFALAFAFVVSHVWAAIIAHHDIVIHRSARPMLVLVVFTGYFFSTGLSSLWNSRPWLDVAPGPWANALSVPTQLAIVGFSQTVYWFLYLGMVWIMARVYRKFESAEWSGTMYRLCFGYTRDEAVRSWESSANQKTDVEEGSRGEKEA